MFVCPVCYIEKDDWESDDDEEEDEEEEEEEEDDGWNDHHCFRCEKPLAPEEMENWTEFWGQVLKKCNACGWKKDE
jgi:hypothetical protein